MFFDLSKPQKLLQQSVRDFCKQQCPLERVRELMETDSAMEPSLWSDISEQGWIGLHLGEEFGGLGLGLVELAVVAEELGRTCTPGPWLNTNWAATLLAAAGGSAATEALPKLTDGSLRATVAVLEDHSSWNLDPSTLETRVHSHGSQLTGRKISVLHAAQSDVIACLAQAGTELSLVLVPGQATGLRFTETPGIDPTRKLYQCDFDRVPISTAQIIATGTTARAAWETSQQVCVVTACAEMLGLMQWMLETTVDYAKTRQQFEQPIGSFQSVQAMCADMLLMTESARSAVWYAAWALQEQDADANRAVSVAKVYLSDAARQVGNLAVQSHGGIGFTWEHDLHLYYKRAKADEYLFGDANFHRAKLADIVFASKSSP